MQTKKEDTIILYGKVAEPIYNEMAVVVRIDKDRWYKNVISSIKLSGKSNAAGTYVTNAYVGQMVEIEIKGLTGSGAENYEIFLEESGVVFDCGSIDEELKNRGIDSSNIEREVNNKKTEAEDILNDSEKTSKLLDQALNMCDKLSRLPRIGGLFNDIPWVCFMISDYVKGEYREVPLATIITLTAAIMYIVSPIDLIPDALPIVGYLDDAIALSLVLEAAQNDLQAYKVWKNLEQE